jgi:hypothetical protein
MNEYPTLAIIDLMEFNRKQHHQKQGYCPRLATQHPHHQHGGNQ